MTTRAPERPLAGPSGTTAGAGAPPARERALGRLRGENPWVGWGAALGVALLAFGLRVWHLGTPRDFSFDETYYAKDAWSMLNHGYVRDYVEDADKLILDGRTTGIWTDDPAFIVHPEAGKWLIALGEKAFGMDPFGWRIASAVVGALMVLVMVRLARRLTGSTLLGCVAGLLLCFDGLHLVLSRLALLDIFAAFFLLCGVACLVNDRDWFRARLGRLAPDGVQQGFGPVRRLLLRPWLLLGGVSFGLAVGTKWTALFPLAAFGVLAWAWSSGARRLFGVRRAVLRSALVDGVPAFFQLIGVALLVYVATWGGWLVHAHDYEASLSSSQYTRYDHQQGCKAISAGNDRWPSASEPDASGPAELVQSLHSLWNYHQDVYAFHAHFLNCADHTYQSRPSGWLLLNRPVGVEADVDIQPGSQGCDAPRGSDCLRQVILLGTPAVWWGGAVALLFAVVMWVGRRDWRYGLTVVGAASTWLPWLMYDDRPIFLFYAILVLPFLVLALTLAMGTLIGPSSAPSRRRTVGVVAAGSFFVLVVLNFAWFWPIWTDGLLTHSEWLDRIWFDRWV